MFEIILRLVLTIVWLTLAIIMLLYFMVFKFDMASVITILKDLIKDYKTVWQKCDD